MSPTTEDLRQRMADELDAAPRPPRPQRPGPRRGPAPAAGARGTPSRWPRPAWPWPPSCLSRWSWRAATRAAGTRPGPRRRPHHHHAGAGRRPGSRAGGRGARRSRGRRHGDPGRVGRRRHCDARRPAAAPVRRGRADRQRGRPDGAHACRGAADRPLHGSQRLPRVDEVQPGSDGCTGLRQAVAASGLDRDILDCADARFGNGFQVLAESERLVGGSQSDTPGETSYAGSVLLLNKGLFVEIGVQPVDAETPVTITAAELVELARSADFLDLVRVGTTYAKRPGAQPRRDRVRERRPGLAGVAVSGGSGTARPARCRRCPSGCRRTRARRRGCRRSGPRARPARGARCRAPPDGGVLAEVEQLPGAGSTSAARVEGLGDDHVDDAGDPLLAELGDDRGDAARDLGLAGGVASADGFTACTARVSAVRRARTSPSTRSASSISPRRKDQRVRAGPRDADVGRALLVARCRRCARARGSHGDGRSRGPAGWTRRPTGRSRRALRGDQVEERRADAATLRLGRT